MKTTIKSAFILAVLSVSLFSCTKSNDPNDDLTGVLSGTIDSYVSGTMDSVQMANGNLANSTGAVSSAGKFSIRLKVPTELSKVRTYLSQGTFTFATGFTISDTTALVSAQFQLYARKGNALPGSVNHCNDLYYNQYYTAEISPYSTVGGTVTFFIYSTKATIINGTLMINGAQGNIYNLTLIEGWNEVARTTTSATIPTTKYLNGSYTTDIPSDLKWYYTEEFE